MKLTFLKNENYLEDLVSREYLLTNGRGGYASSSLADCHTRKYHGLLALPLANLHQAYLLLSKVETSLAIGSKQYDLSLNRFPGTYFPEGYKYIKSFVYEDYPQTTYLIEEEGVCFSKSILMKRGEDAVYLHFSLEDAPKALVVKLAPFLAYRPIHGLAHQNIDIRPRTYFEPNGFKIDPYPGLPALFLQTSKLSTFFPSPDWWRNFEYIEEERRGYEYREDLFCPGIFEVKLKKGESFGLRAGLNSLDPVKIKNGFQEELKRLKQEHSQYTSSSEPLSTLKIQTRHYVLDEPAAVLAGYPWFCNEWGRDTFIALPGLLLATGNYGKAFDILSRFASLEKDGLLPNTLEPVQGKASYNAVDVPFLFCLAVQRYVHKSGERQQVASKLIPKVISILNTFIEGRCPVARLKENGLLYAGNQLSQLTWMDASIAGLPVTPRAGAPVEVNALYYNALCFVLEEWAPLLDTPKKEAFLKMRRLFESNFSKLFWNEERGCLYDVVREDGKGDASIRPNMLFAIGLPYTCLDESKALQVLEVVKNHLLTPYGLRSLAQSDPVFCPQYAGSQEERDRAYHQGVIWPWLLGIFWDALKKNSPDRRAAGIYLRHSLAPLWNEHLTEGCLLQISELFTPLIPHLATGCPAQAWSLAEVVRVLDEIEAEGL